MTHLIPNQAPFLISSTSTGFYGPTAHLQRQQHQLPLFCQCSIPSFHLLQDLQDLHQLQGLELDHRLENPKKFTTFEIPQKTPGCGWHKESWCWPPTSFWLAHLQERRKLVVGDLTKFAGKANEKHKLFRLAWAFWPC